ncbi:NmrA family NAD(P)-binding protein [Nonomuraea sp. 3-1Str]|uniref:SDR family oxidoreductase n=1 Tax=Nonomuraea sp. 3-1Str TaxID=2929801 RepID=UPI00286528E8|nr:NmrA family NAD(P)-binding protein [Nonomuraea sp. 3-1Str]MDR8410060.1 NmrA family NAD(P)-binding protein [Nonomuraea sp. 3-1Str]
MRILVIGAGGAQGGAVARRLAAEGYEVRGLSRTGAAPDGVRPFAADLGDVARVREAFDGVTHVSVTVPLVFEAELVEAYVRNVLGAAAAARVRRLVLNTGNRLPARATGVAAFDTRRKAAAAALGSGVPSVVLSPPLYLENLAAPGVWGPLVERGVLRQPLPGDVPVSWLAHADLAAATLGALTGDGPVGAVLEVGGPPVTGAELAAAAGARYEEQDVAVFEAGLAAALGPGAAAGVADTYRWIAAHGRDLYGADGTAGRPGTRVTSPREWLAARLRAAR